MHSFSPFLGLFLLFKPELTAVMEWIYLLLEKIEVLAPKLLVQQEKKKNGHGSNFALGDTVSMLVSGNWYVGRQIF